MHEQLSLEQRVAAIEDDLAAVKQQVLLASPKKEASLADRVDAIERLLARVRPCSEVPAQEASNWLDHVIGSLKDYPEWEEVLKLGAEFLARIACPTDSEPRCFCTYRLLFSSSH